MADARRLDSILWLVRRSAAARRWVLLHLVAGVVGAAATVPDMLAFGDYERSVFLFKWLPAWNPIGVVLGFPAAILLLAALPSMLYQAWELAPNSRPACWLASAALMLTVSPALLLFVALPLLRMVVLALPVPESDLFWYGYATAAFAVGALWAAPVQWLAIRKGISFLHWWMAAGPTLGLAAVVAALGFFWAFVDSGLVWLLSMPVAALIYAVGTLPALSSLLRQKGAPLGPAAPL